MPGAARASCTCPRCCFFFCCCCRVASAARCLLLKLFRFNRSQGQGAGALRVFRLAALLRGLPQADPASHFRGGGMAIPMAWAAIPTGDPPSPRGFLHPHVCAAIPRCEPAIPRCDRPSPGANPPSPRVSGHPHVCAAIPRCERPSPRLGGYPQFVIFCPCGPSRKTRSDAKQQEQKKQNKGTT